MMQMSTQPSPFAEGHLTEATAAEEESAEESASTLEDLQTDLGETLITSERTDNQEDLNNAGALTMAQKMLKQSPIYLSLTKTAGSSREIASYVGTSCHVLLCSARLTALKIHLPSL